MSESKAIQGIPSQAQGPKPAMFQNVNLGAQESQDQKAQQTSQSSFLIKYVSDVNNIYNIEI